MSAVHSDSACSLSPCANPPPHTVPVCLHQIQGYRVRLHFDGYPECYDFWANADSWDLKPAGWCEKNGHKLLLPKGEHEAVRGGGVAPEQALLTAPLFQIVKTGSSTGACM